MHICRKKQDSLFEHFRILLHHYFLIPLQEDGLLKLCSALTYSLCITEVRHYQIKIAYSQPMISGPKFSWEPYWVLLPHINDASSYVLYLFYVFRSEAMNLAHIYSGKLDMNRNDAQQSQFLLKGRNPTLWKHTNFLLQRIFYNWKLSTFICKVDNKSRSADISSGNGSLWDEEEALASELA